MEDWGQGCSEVAKGAGVRDALEQETATGTGLLRTGRRTWGLGCSGGGRSPSGAARPFGTPKLGPLCMTSPSPGGAAPVSAQRCPAAQLGLRRCFPPRHCPSRPGSTSQPVPNAPRGHELLHLLAPNPAPRCQLTLGGLAPGIAGTCCAASVIWGPWPSPGATPRGRGVGSPSPPPYCRGRPRCDGAVAHPARGSVPARRWLPSR